MVLEGSIIVGLMAGWVAGMLFKASPHGIVGDMIMGLVGGLVGGLLGGLVVRGPGISLIPVATAILGSIALIVLLRAIPGRTLLS